MAPMQHFVTVLITERKGSKNTTLGTVISDWDLPNTCIPRVGEIVCNTSSDKGMFAGTVEQIQHNVLEYTPGAVFAGPAVTTTVWARSLD